MKLTLAAILGDLSEERLRAHLASREILHLPGGSGLPPDQIYTMAEWERLILRRGIDPSDLRITFAGNKVDLGATGAGDTRGRPRPIAVRDFARQGASIVTTHLDRYEPRLQDLLWDVERHSGARGLIHVIGSFSARHALHAHYDRDDLIVVQLSGGKIWRFYGEPATGVSRRNRRNTPPTEVTGSVTLAAGDLLILPAGVYHECEAIGHSLHLAVGIEQPEPADFVRHLLDSDDVLNEPLSPLLGPQAVAAREAAFKARLIELVEKADIAAWLARRNAGRGAMTSLGLLGDGDPDAPGAIAALTIALPPVPRPDGRLEAQGKSLDPTPAMRALLAALTEGDRPVAELLDARPDARPALDDLVAKGLVRIFDGSASAPH